MLLRAGASHTTARLRPTTPHLRMYSHRIQYDPYEVSVQAARAEIGPSVHDSLIAPEIKQNCQFNSMCPI
ncbi:hypothetical protein ANCCAN_02980 [Ancylostoma caninum]|uniref:Uncharacterized protein n=1 Tax=Ancylostoma caninum TaxID=29170 RepID=A0A368H6S3_ANCCA|nr:hypothetical protein ANCCAN_02980 [Ancylostoma caninum]